MFLWSYKERRAPITLHPPPSTILTLHHPQSCTSCPSAWQKHNVIKIISVKVVSEWSSCEVTEADQRSDWSFTQNSLIFNPVSVWRAESCDLTHLSSPETPAPPAAFSIIFYCLCVLFVGVLKRSQLIHETEIKTKQLLRSCRTLREHTCKQQNTDDIMQNITSIWLLFHTSHVSFTDQSKGAGLNPTWQLKSDSVFIWT